MHKTIKNFFASRAGIIATGATIGLIAALLVHFGNPANMGVCVACFLRDSVGALGFHRAGIVQYLRPELAGFVLGSMAAALIAREFRARGGSAPLIRFALGFFAMIGALVFLGCPWRAIIRSAGGDLNGLVGLAGLVAGVSVGVVFLKSGYSLGRTCEQPRVTAFLMPLVSVILLAFLVIKNYSPEGFPLFSSTEGPGSKHAPLFISLAAGLIIGVVAQRSRFCTVGSFRDIFVIKDYHLFSGVAAMFLTVLVFNLASGNFKIGFESQPVAHSSHIFNFAGMLLSSLAFVLAGGCPGRQFIMSGEGDSDAAIFIAGMGAGAAFAHNFKTASSAAGPGEFSGAALIAGLAACLIIAAACTFKNTRRS